MGECLIVSAWFAGEPLSQNKVISYMAGQKKPRRQPRIQFMCFLCNRTKTTRPERYSAMQPCSDCRRKLLKSCYRIDKYIAVCKVCEKNRLTPMYGDFLTHTSVEHMTFRCECGKVVNAKPYSVISGRVKSCGCYSASLASSRMTKHGLTGHYLYNTWLAMRERCRSPNHRQYCDYGGRGIEVCGEWDDFARFVSDMGDRPKGYTLERIDVNGNYCKDNCKWASRKDQASNTRLSALRAIMNERELDYSDVIEMIEENHVRTTQPKQG